MCVLVAEFAKVSDYPGLENFICEEMSQHVEDTRSLWGEGGLIELKGEEISVII